MAEPPGAVETSEPGEAPDMEMGESAGGQADDSMEGVELGKNLGVSRLASDMVKHGMSEDAALKVAGSHVGPKTPEERAQAIRARKKAA